MNALLRASNTTRRGGGTIFRHRQYVCRSSRLVTCLLEACLIAGVTTAAQGAPCPANGIVVNDLLSLTEYEETLTQTTLEIEAEFQNSSGKGLLNLNFIPSESTENIDESTEPRLGGLLAPGEKTGPLTFSVEHSGEPFQYFVDACATERYNVEITTFIPYDFGLPAFPLSALAAPMQTLLIDLIPVLPNPVITGQGDGRAFDQDADDYRTRQTILIDVNANGPTIRAVQNSVASTLLHAVDSNFFFDPVPLAGVEGVLSAAPPSLTSEDEGFTLTLEGSAHTSFLPSLLDIDWSYEITVQSEAGSPHATVRVHGENDSYPAYELYINGVAFVLSFPSENNLLLLAGTGGVEVDRTRSLGD